MISFKMLNTNIFYYLKVNLNSYYPRGGNCVKCLTQYCKTCINSDTDSCKYSKTGDYFKN